MELSYKNYILAIRSNTIFLKRTLKELRINNYNPAILNARPANIEVQYVVDVYPCAAYIASHITKSQRGMGDLLWKAFREVASGNTSVRDQVKQVGNKFLNAIEISAQEALSITLQIRMRKSSSLGK